MHNIAIPEDRSSSNGCLDLHDPWYNAFLESNVQNILLEHENIEFMVKSDVTFIETH